MGVEGPFSIIHSTDAERIIAFIKGRGLVYATEIGFNDKAVVGYLALPKPGYAVMLSYADVPYDVQERWHETVLSIFSEGRIVFHKRAKERYSIIGSDMCYLYEDSMIVHEYGMSDKSLGGALVIFTEGDARIDVEFVNALASIGMELGVAVALSLNKGHK